MLTEIILKKSKSFNISSQSCLFMKLEESYNKLKSKYNLPEFNELNLIFEIDDIGCESNLILQKIREKIDNKIITYIEIIEAIVQPETNLRDMYETKYVNDKSKETAYTLFKKLMLIKRSSDLISIENKEDDNAKFIKETYESYIRLKPDIFKHVEKLKIAWEKDTNIKNDLNYFG